MKWKRYSEWIKDKIFTEDESDDFRINYELSDDAKKIYKSSEETELTKILNDIVLSIDREGWRAYYPLPIYQKRKTWQELFPNRLNTFFGEKPKDNDFFYDDVGPISDNEEEENKPEISQENWDILANIYADFQEWLKWEGTLLDAEEIYDLLLRKGREGEKVFKDYIEETFLKSDTCQDFIHRAETWLEEFRNLDSDQKERLENQKERIKEILYLLHNQRNISSNKWPLPRIIKWGGYFFLGVLVALGIVWIINRVRSLLKK